MGCRIGMAVDVDARISELKAQREVPEYATCTILASELNYYQANQLEQKWREECGPDCDGQLGGRIVAGNVWNVYQLDW